MSHYKHLTISERESLHEMRITGNSLTAIAITLGRSKSTISRELRRNTSIRKGYSPFQATEKYKKRRKKCHRVAILLNESMREKVISLLKKNWSPQQIENRLRMEGRQTVSYTTIYRALHNSLMEDGNNFKRKKQKWYRPPLEIYLRKKGGKKGRGTMRGRLTVPHTIHERSYSAQNRTEAGHWEADTIHGKNGGSVLLTLVDRKTRYTLLRKCSKIDKFEVAASMIDALYPFRNELKSITPDRGKEFFAHAIVTQALNSVPFYFPDPYAPGQRGTNENTNGLLREFFPKNRSLDNVTSEQLLYAQNSLNNRPRAILNWLTPYEAHFGCLLHLT